MKTKIPIPDVVKDLKDMFLIDKETEFKSFEVENKFMIHKQSFEMCKVIEMLQDYFKDKYIDGGYITIRPICLLFTSFEIKTGNPE